MEITIIKELLGGYLVQASNGDTQFLTFKEYENYKINHGKHRGI